MRIHAAPRALNNIVIASLLIAVAMIVIDTPAQAGSRTTCPANHFCVWTEASFNGTRHDYGDVDEYNAIEPKNIGSAYNNRSKRTYLNEGPGSSTTWSCFGPYDYDSSLSTWQLHAESVFLSTYTNCPS